MKALSIVLFVLAAGCQPSASSTPEKRSKEAVPVTLALCVLDHSPWIVQKSATVLAEADVDVASETSGVIVRRCVQEGSPVEKGQAIIELDATVETAAQRAAEARVVSLRSVGGDLALRLEAEARLSESEDALRRRTLRAPFQGHLDRFHVEEGDHLTPGRTVARCVDTTRLKVIPTALESEIPLVSVGAEVDVTIPALADLKVKGRINRIAKASVRNSGSFEVEVVLEANEGLRPGFVAEVALPLGTPRPRLTIPREAIFQRHGSERVFVAKGLTPRIAEERMVRFSALPGQPERALVIEGLAEGEWVITRGRVGLTEGDPLLSDTP